MEAIYNYIIQSGLCLLLLYMFYMLVLRSFPKPAYNRLYLLLAPLLALVIPVLDLPLPYSQSYNFAPALPTIQLTEVTITAYTSPAKASITNAISTEFILGIVYLLAAVAFLVRLGVQLFMLRNMVATATPLPGYTSKITVLQTSNNYPTFAFLNYIFVSSQHYLTEQERQQILTHEVAHVKLRHTYDVLYYELLTAILWFNPFVWLLKAELRDVHEYQADAEVISVYQPQDYTSLLAKEALYKTGIPVGSYFQKPQVFKRLHMLRKHGQKSGVLRPLLVLPFLLALLFFFSSRDVTADITSSITSPVTQADSEKTPPKQKQTIAEPQQMPEVTVTAKAPEKELPKSKPEEIAPKPVQTDKDKTPDPEQEPYEFVELMPVFEGGDLELKKFIAKNLRYPKTTREAGTEGLVVATFVIETDGSLTNITILKSLDDAADKEAKRVIESMEGKWLPGKQNGNAVPVRFAIPIRFALLN